MKLIINTQCCVSSEGMDRNTALSPELPPPAGEGRLAVVGGGPSLLETLEEVRAWEGDIWAINGTCQWLLSHDIDAVLFSVDPDPILAALTEGVSTAVLADHCAPKAFEALQGATVYKATGRMPGPTSAVAAATIALNAGYSGVTYFGCECSFTDRTHAYEEQDPPDLVRVSCGGESFLTKLEMILQAEQLSKIIREFPDRYEERCGGFLRAMIERGDYDVTHISKSMHLEPA